MAITNEVDLTHIARTTEQWENTYDRNVIIPEGVLCIEFTPSGKTNIKIGDGHHIFSRLPYVNGSSEIIDCYTKQETDNRIIQILNNECVVRIKGILDDASKLPVHAACGDLWFVIRQNPEQGNKFEEYLYSSEHHWELIGGTPVDIDLSKYATKEYVDGKIRDIENKLHTHDNKSILDQITAVFTKEEKEKLKNLYNYDDTELRELIVKSLHTHSNKEVLDAITKYDIDKLRTLENYDDTLLKKKITALEALAHEHSNKSILDKTTASFTTDYERLMSLIRLYIGATGFDDGAAGLVPPALAGEQNYVLTGSGKWVPNTGGSGETYELPIASATELGGIKIGEGLEISEDGTLSVIGGGSGSGNYNEGDGIKFKQEAGKPLYQVLEYIEATGTQRIDTDIMLTGTSHVVDITYQFTDISVDNYLYTVGGIFDTGGQVYGILRTNSQELCSGVGQGGQAYNYVAVSPPTEKTSDTYFVNSTSFGSTLTGSKGHQIPILNDAISFFGFIRNTYTNYLGKVKLYGCTVKCDDVIKANFIPVMRISDNVSGLYDTVSKKFFTNTYNETPFVTGNPTEEVISDYITTINVKPATETEIGGVIIGDGINIDENGVISVDASAAINLKPGNGLEIVDVVNPEHTELPNGYSEISYLESLNGQYTIIDYVPNENTRVVCEFSYQESNVGDQCLFGTRTGNTSGSRQFVLWMEWDSSKPYTGFVYGGNNWGGADVPSDGYALTCEIGQKMVADVSVNGYYLDNTLIHTVTNTGSPSAYKLAIFHLSNSNTTVESNKTAFKGRIYSFKIYENDVLVANLVPAIVMALNIPGFYDVINNKFYQSSTSNSFTYDASSVIIGSGKKQINLLPATMENIGGVKIGDGLSITEEGVLSATASTVYNAGKGISITKGSHKIPVEYQEIEYIESAGDAIFDTGYLANPSTVIDMDCIVYESSKADWQFLYGSRSSTYDTATVFGFVVRNYHKGYVPELWISGEQLGTSSTFPYNERTILKQNMNELTWYPVSTEVPVTITGTGSLPTSSTTLAVSGFKDGSTYTFGPKCRIYSLKISDVNGITRDYVPCYRISDGVVGLYDLINDTFRYSATSTAFISGPVVSDSGGSTDDEKLYINNAGLLDANLKEDAPGVIIVSKADETKELDVFQYMTDIEVYCVEDSI